MDTDTITHTVTITITIRFYIRNTGVYMCVLEQK